MPSDNTALDLSYRRVGLIFVTVAAAIAFILATPERVCADTIYVSGTISSDETWTSGNVYAVNGDLTVASGVTLTIEAGVVVKLDADAALTVEGQLTVQGTEGDDVYFTSLKDDSVGAYYHFVKPFSVERRVGV